MRIALFFLVIPWAVHAADPGPFVTVHVTPHSGVTVGQRITLSVTLATPDLFADIPEFEIPPRPGIIVMPPAGSPVLGSQRSGNTTFTTQTHDFSLYAQRPGTVEIPAFPIRFHSNAGFGTPAIAREVITPAISLTISSPPGTRQLGTVIATSELTVSDHWKPEHLAAQVGDAFTLIQTVRAANVPGMLLPPLRYDPIAGVALYPHAPVVTDQTNRGDLTGVRTDTITVVMEKSGRITIPQRTLTWFDLNTQTLKTERLPGRTFTVLDAANTGGTASPPAAIPVPSGSAHDRFWLGGPLAGLLGLAIGYRWFRTRSGEIESEPAVFSRLGIACRTGNPHTVYAAWLGWLDRFGPLSIDEFLAQADDPKLNQSVLALRNRLYGRVPHPEPAEATTELWTRFKAARQRLIRQRRIVATRGIIPPLNPPARPTGATGR